jgi:nitroreductase
VRQKQPVRGEFWGGHQHFRRDPGGLRFYACDVEFSEVIKRRKMVRAFTGEPLAPGVTDRLLRAGNRAPSAGFSQGYSFLVLEGMEQAAPLWEIFYEDAGSDVSREAEERAEIAALSSAHLVIVPLACKDGYLDRYAQPEKGWTDRDESRWPVPYWYIDTGFTALLILLAVVDEGLGAVFFGIQPGIMADFRARFGIPGEWTPIGAIAIGYPDPGADPVPPALASDRKSLDELVHRGRW